VAEGGGESRVEGLSKMFSSVEVGVEVDKGVIGRGLSGDGVRGHREEGRGLWLLVDEGAIDDDVGGRERVDEGSKEKEVVELIRNIGSRHDLYLGVLWSGEERAGGRGRSGERGRERR